MKYKVKVWCNDCTGVDEQGCNDGFPWYITDDDSNIRLFDTEAEADEAGWKAVDGVGPWRFEVEEVDE